jgi:hypothetical protein
VVKLLKTLGAEKFAFEKFPYMIKAPSVCPTAETLSEAASSAVKLWPAYCCASDEKSSETLPL